MLAVGGVVFAIGAILVLLLVRGGGDDGPQAAPTPTATDTAPAGAATPEPAPGPELVVTEGASQQVLIPTNLEIPEGHEAVAIDLGYSRATALLAQLGDRVHLYRVPNLLAYELDIEREVDSDGDGEPDTPASQLPEGQVRWPSAPPDAIDLGLEVEVLAIVGNHPAVRGGATTLIVAVPVNAVAELLPVVEEGTIWATLLPAEG